MTCSNHFRGARPSLGAASSSTSVAPGFSEPFAASDLAAPEDGRTPLTYYTCSSRLEHARLQRQAHFDCGSLAGAALDLALTANRFEAPPHILEAATRGMFQWFKAATIIGNGNL